MKKDWRELISQPKYDIKTEGKDKHEGHEKHSRKNKQQPGPASPFQQSPAENEIS